MTSGRALNVMQVAPNLDIGGAQETARTLARYLPRLGCPTVVCAFEDGALRPEIERMGVTVELLPPRRHSFVALPLFVIEMIERRRRLLELVRRHGIDVVQTQGLGILDFLVMTLRMRAEVQVWWTIQNANFMVRGEHLVRHRWLLRPKRAAHRWLYRLGARVVNGVIAVSDETARAFRAEVGGTAGRITVVCNAVDVERYASAPEGGEVRSGLGRLSGDHVMTMVATFKAQKGHRYLVDAAASVTSISSCLHILFVGDGELIDEVKAQVKAAGLMDRIHFLGSRRDVARILAASDSFVLPSLWEGLPVALVEAMASGLPVIATQVSGTSQVMVDGVTGWLVPPRDTTALELAIIELLSDPDRARRMGAAARARVAAHFGARAQAEQLAALFRAGSSSPRTTPRSARVTAG